MSESIIWSPGMSLEALEKLVILNAYRFFRFNKVQTSNSLGIAVRTLDNKLQQYDKEADLEKEREQNELRKRTEFLAKQRGNPPNNIGIPYSPVCNSFGVHMESITNASTQQSVPMPQRKEVQEVLPKPAAQVYPKKGR